MERVRDFQYRDARFETKFCFYVLTEIGQQVIRARCYEISEGGLTAWLSEPLDIDANVTLIFRLPGNSNEMAVAASVSRRHGSHHVFVFRPASEHDRAQLRQFLLPQID